MSAVALRLRVTAGPRALLRIVELLTLPEAPAPGRQGFCVRRSHRRRFPTGYDPTRGGGRPSRRAHRGVHEPARRQHRPVALPSIQRGSAPAPSAVQWVVSGYALTFGLALVPAGRLGDAMGRRKMFLVALAAFVLCSATAGAAPTPGVLVAARLARGSPQARGAAELGADPADVPRRGAWKGVRVLRLDGRAVDGGRPDRGGVILALAGEQEGWRWVFFVNVPIGVVALVLAARLIPRAVPGPRQHIDVGGVGSARRGRARADAPAGAGRGGRPAHAVVAVLARRGGARRLRLVGAARRGPRQAAAPRHRTADRNARLRLRRAARHGLLHRLQRHLAGVRAVPAVGVELHPAAARAWPSRRSRSARPPRPSSAAASSRSGGGCSVAGLALVVLGLAVTAVIVWLAPPGDVGWWMAPPLLIAGIGGGWVVAPNTTMTLRCVPVDMAGSAGGALQTGQRIGGAIGTAALPGVYYALLAMNGRDFATAAAISLAAAVVSVVVALGVAIGEWRSGKRRSETASGAHRARSRRRVSQASASLRNAPGAAAGSPRRPPAASCG